jgi:hypothetical protein
MLPIIRLRTIVATTETAMITMVVVDNIWVCIWVITTRAANLASTKGRRKRLQDGLGNQLVEVTYFLKHSLIDHLVRFFGCHFIDKAIERYHS